MPTRLPPFVCCLLAAALTGPSGQAADWPQVQAHLQQYCADCHGADEPAAQLRLDKLGGFSAKQSALWAQVYQALAGKVMPPEEESQPTSAERQEILDWIVEQTRAHAVRQTLPRRLNRREFTAALQDLTGLPIDYGAALPADGRLDGFDTGALALQDAADSVHQHMEVARRAVDSVRFLDPENSRSLSLDFREHAFTDFRKWVEKELAGSGIFTRSKRITCQQGIGLTLETQWPGDRGNSFLAFPAPADKRAVLRLQFKVRAERDFEGVPIPMLWVKIGGQYIDYVPIDETPRTLTYAVRMEDQLIEGGVIKVMLRSIVEMPYAVEGFENDDRSKPGDNIPGGFGTYRPRFDRKVFRTIRQQPVPRIVMERIDVDYDHQAAWPPDAWETRIVMEDSPACAEELLGLWIERAWRRPSDPLERARYLDLYHRLRGQGASFDDALRAAFQAVLMSGPFRYLASPASGSPQVAAHALASRLSFMLTGSPPDARLRRLAREGAWGPSALDSEARRLLSSADSDAFFRPFVMGWLQLDQPITLAMSHIKKQDFRFGRYLKDSLKEETIRYVQRLFTENRPARELIESDWSIRNNILAVHYKESPRDDATFRSVPLSPQAGDGRGGGLLGHAGIQSMLCWMGDNWVIYRGAWLARHVLDDPPPPPPLEVPELVAEDHKGKTYRELLAIHQQDPKCATCHKTIDPLGFAFQNFDLSGRWRNVEYDHYHRYEIDGKIEWRGEGKTRPVDAAGALPRGETFAGYAEFKTQLLDHYLDDIVRGILKKLTLYGTGRTANVLDLLVIDSIMREHRDNGYRLGDLLVALLESPVFLETDFPLAEKSP